MKRSQWLIAWTLAMLLLLAACGSNTTNTARIVPLDPVESLQTADEPETTPPAESAAAVEAAAPAEAESTEAESAEAAAEAPEPVAAAEPEGESEIEPVQPIQSGEPDEAEDAPTREASPETPDGSGDASNLNTYDDKSQQDTDDRYVLNTNTKKIHNPWCSSVPKISPKNYATTNKSVEELEAEGYTKCGQKGDWK